MNQVPVGEIGEMVYRGPTVMKGYWNNPKANEEAFRGGWFHSGDLCRMDEDGCIYVMDRKHDMIISGGENVYPREVDDVLCMHPAVQDAASVGAPDAYRGEVVRSFVVLRAGAQATLEELLESLKVHEDFLRRVVPPGASWLSQLRGAIKELLKSPVHTVVNLAVEPRSVRACCR